MEVTCKKTYRSVKNLRIRAAHLQIGEIASLVLGSVRGAEDEVEVTVGELSECTVRLQDARGGVDEEDVVVHDLARVGPRPVEGHVLNLGRERRVCPTLILLYLSHPKQFTALHTVCTLHCAYATF